MKLSLAKTCLAFILILANSAFAANLINQDSTEGLDKIGSVSVTGGSTLSEVNNALAEKTREMGGSSYVITSAGGG